MTTIPIGKSPDGPVRLDVERLLKTRMLVTANSGGGKSWLLRLLFEQLGQSTPLIVLDKEGEFFTLRERLDVLLVGPHGEIPTDVRSAGLLVRRLMERRISAVIDMSELPLGQQRRYVRLFLEAMIGLPKDLWHPCFVGLDETHFFCPEKGSGEAESTEAVISLATLGRKRGFCPIFATQRISKFHKDAAAELLNKFIGRTTLDVDQKRAADELGIGKDEGRALRDLSPPGHEGEFYGFGPALEQGGVVRFRVGKVATTHPEAGQGKTIEPPKPSRAIAAVLGELKDLPQKAEEEAKSLADAQRTIQDLRRQLNARPQVIDEAAVNTAVTKAVAARDKEWEAAIKERDGIIGNLKHRMHRASVYVSEITPLLHVNGESLPTVKVAPAKSQATLPTPARPVARPAAVTMRPAPSATSTGDLPKGEAAVLASLIQYPDGLRREQLTVLTGYKRSSRDAYIQRLREKGYVGQEGERIVATAEGQAALPNAEPLPTGEALQQFWLNRLPAGERAILEVLISVYPDAVSRQSLEETTGYKRSSRDAYLQRLSAKELITEPARGEVRASDQLF